MAIITSINASDKISDSRTTINTNFSNLDAKLPFKVVGTTADQADYVCDGTADDVQIQEAIDAVNTAGGGIVFIKAGTYNVSVRIDHSEGVNVMGGGRDATIIKNSGIIGAPVWRILGSHTSLSDITIDGDHGSISAVLDLYRATDETEIISDITIKNCHITQMGAASGWLFVAWDREATSFKLRDITIDNCIFDDYPNEASDNFAISACENVKVTNCIFDLKRVVIIYLSRKVIFSNNTFRNFSGYASLVVGGDDIVVDSNIFEDTNTVGAKIRVVAENSLVTGKNIVFSNNVMRKFGLGLATGSYNELLNVLVDSNVFDMTDGTGAGAILVEPSAIKKIEVMISNNRIKNCYSNGIYISNSDIGNKISIVNIVNNVIANTRLSGSGYWGGIVTYEPKTLISGNYIYDDQVAPTSYQGIYVNTDADGCIVENNYVRDQANYVGIHINSDYNLISNNKLYNNGVGGIYIADNNTGNQILNNSLIDNGTLANNLYSSILLGATNTYTIISGNYINEFAANKVKYGISESAVTDDYNRITNNIVLNAVTQNIRRQGASTVVLNNTGTNLVEDRELAYVKNTSGGNLVAGNVVVLKAVAAGNEFTTTTTQGDDLVIGMLSKAIANNAWGYVQTLGKTTLLKVDGTTNIAIGDFLGTFTTAGIAMKATTGDMAFAIALEAYTTDDSAGVIDALLIVPRKL